MHELRRSALLGCSAERMFSVITDVERYPEFVPYCVGAAARVDDPASGSTQGASAMLASLDLAARGFSERFTTRNLAVPYERVEMQLVSGPFSHFQGVWTLTPIGERGCRTELHVQFEFRRGLQLLGRMVSRSLMHSADRVVDAFCLQAESGNE